MGGMGCLALMLADGEHGQDRTRPFGNTAARLQRVVVQARAIEDVTAVHWQVAAVEQRMLRAALFTHPWSTRNYQTMTK